MHNAYACFRNVVIPYHCSAPQMKNQYVALVKHYRHLHGHIYKGEIYSKNSYISKSSNAHWLVGRIVRQLIQILYT